MHESGVLSLAVDQRGNDREEMPVLRPFAKRDDGALAEYVGAFRQALNSGRS